MSKFEVELKDGSKVVCEPDLKTGKAVCHKEVPTKREDGSVTFVSIKKKEFDISRVKDEGILQALDANFPPDEHDIDITKIAQKFIPTWIRILENKD